MTRGEKLAALLQEAAAQTGASFKESQSAIAAYADQRITHLETCVGEPGYELVVAVERDNVMLFAAEKGLDLADAADQRTYGLIHGALAFVIAVA